MKEFLKRLWEGVNGISAIDFQLHGRTREKPENDVQEKEDENSVS
jgi:hypothetical protein